MDGGGKKQRKRGRERKRGIVTMQRKGENEDMILFTYVKLFYVRCRFLEKDIIHVERRQQPLRYMQVHCF